MVCENCGAQIMDNAKFCGKCGAEIKLPFVCENCGNPVSFESLFCDNCGTSFKDNIPEEEKVKRGAMIRGTVFCTISALLVGYAFVNSLIKGEAAKGIKMHIVISSVLAILCAVISCIEYFRSKGKCSIVVYICMILAAVFLIVWLIEGDRIEAERLAEYYASERAKMQEVLDGMRHDALDSFRNNANRY
ncbi:MAG: zinc ribbon domain-containing protein [Ruminococcaceae bacterium]|nr:zinc ribbon domain-containing protein [Oscillospiraceae bacterium]